MEPEVATVGIDFGCKNSRVAVIESLVPQVIDSEIRQSTPSYVTLTELNSNSPHVWSMQHLDYVGKCVSVGQIAKYKMLKQPSDVVFNIKKLIGKKFDDYHIQEMRKSVYFSIVEGPRGEAWVEVHGMKSCSESTNHPNRRKQQREDIKLAGSKAGLDVLQVIDETTAAVLSSTRKGIVVVFGMGAGSYSISILDVPDTNMKDMKVKAQSSDPFVGGDQFDNILLDYFVSRIMELHSVNIRGDKYAMTVLAEKVEQVKVDLSNQHEVTISIPFFTASAEGPVDLNITISRLEFEKLANDLIEQIKHKCRSTLKEANIVVKDIDEILFFGGMTRMPKIQRIVYEVFGEHQISRVNPEEAVVIGSAIQAALIVEEHQEMLEGMISLSIGIVSMDRTFTRIIPRNTTLPAKRTVTFPAWCAYKECLHIKIFIGEHLLGRRNPPLGEVLLINNRSSHRGRVDFEVTFEVDKDYVVKVSTTDAGGQFEAADDTRKVYWTFTIDKAVMCKHNVDMIVRDSLLYWMTETSDPLRNLARYVLNTCFDVLSARKDELPKDLFEDGVSMLAELGESLDADVEVLKDKVQSAKSMVSTLLNWMPSESLQSHHLDSED